MASPTQSDFINGPIVDFGIAVTRTPVTVTVNNITGHKEYSDGSTNQVTAVFENANKKYDFDKSGLTEGADARMFIQGDETINKNEKILHQGTTYRVDSISVRHFNGNAIFKTVLLFEIST